MEGPDAVLNVITLPPGATTTQARLVLDGVRGAIFLYENGGPTGALIGSWAISAGTDPYTNAYPQGFDISLGSITVSSGSLSAMLSGGQLQFFFILAMLLSLSANGLFLYTGSGGAGNLIATATPNSGTDPFTNPYEAGVNTYSKVGTDIVAVGLSLVSFGFPGLSIQDITFPPNTPAGGFGQASSGIARFILTSGTETAADTDAQVQLHSQLDSGITFGQVDIQAGNILWTQGNSSPTLSTTTTGVITYKDSIDGNVYEAGHKTIQSSPAQSVTSTSPIAVTGTSVTVAAQAYKIRAHVIFTNVNATQFTLGWQGPAASTEYMSGIFTNGGFGEQKNNLFGATLAGMSASQVSAAHLEGYAVFTAGGTLNVAAQVNSGSCNVNFVDWELIPV